MPDIESGEGAIRVWMDYMYLHEGFGKYRELCNTPPYLIVVEHKYGRCWAHQVLNKGANEGTHWVPKKVLQDLKNNGMGAACILLKKDQELAIGAHFRQ